MITRPNTVCRSSRKEEKQVKSKRLLALIGSVCLVLVLVALSLCPACAPAPVAKDKIVIGASRSLTGPLSFFEENAFGPIYKMWVDDVNAAGGIYVKEYGKKLLVETKVYDDTSDAGMVATNIDKLCVEDKVDFLFGPCGTAMLFAGAPIANKYEKIILCAEGGCTTLTPMLPDLPYVFSVLNFSDHYQMPVMAELFKEWGVKSVYAIYIADLHGAEYLLVGTSELTKVGIPIVNAVSVPMSTVDYAPIIKAAKDSGADAFVAWIYPWMINPAFEQSIALDYNPKVWLGGPGVNFENFRTTWGDANIEGVIGEGAWSRKSSPEASAFADKFIARWGAEHLDWWGHLVYYSALQHFQQAIEKAGTLDSKTVRDVMATSTFDTILGPMWWQVYDNGGGLLPQECYAGQIGQWQNGLFEVIDPGEKRTAEPIYPKPAFPK